MIWVGTDDGNLQLTRDGGKTWSNVVGNIGGLPTNAWVSSVEPGHFDPGDGVRDVRPPHLRRHAARTLTSRPTTGRPGSRWCRRRHRCAATRT